MGSLVSLGQRPNRAMSPMCPSFRVTADAGVCATVFAEGPHVIGSSNERNGAGRPAGGQHAVLRPGPGQEEAGGPRAEGVPEDARRLAGWATRYRGRDADVLRCVVARRRHTTYWVPRQRRPRRSGSQRVRCTPKCRRRMAICRRRIASRSAMPSFSICRNISRASRSS